MTQLVKPNTSVTDGAGWCLRFTQSVYGTAAMHESAWKAWLATKHKHTGALPNLSVPVWFSHYGTYGYPARYDNWGHVVAYVPGKGFLSSPAFLRPGQTRSQQWFPSIAAVEQAFNAKYVGWSEDLNGTRIVNAAGSGSGSTGGITVSEADRIIKEIDGLKAHVTNQFNITRGSSWLGWIKSRIGGSYKGENLTSKLNRTLGGISGLDLEVNLDPVELADAIADELEPRMSKIDAKKVVDELAKRLSE